MRSAPLLDSREHGVSGDEQLGHEPQSPSDRIVNGAARGGSLERAPIPASPPTRCRRIDHVLSAHKSAMIAWAPWFFMTSITLEH